MHRPLFSSLKVPILAQQQVQINRLIDEFSAWNEKMNLSAHRTRDEVAVKQVSDSLLGLSFAQISKGGTVADLGSGGGFPALPIAIFRPDLTVFAIDSVAKKMAAVTAIAKALEIPNLKTVSGRLETLGRDPKFRETFDAVTARALAPWPVLLELALPFVRVGGHFFAWQTPSILGDLESCRSICEKLGGRIEKALPYALPDGSGDRLLVVVSKIAKTPREFPRGVGVPKKSPLQSNA